MKKFQLKMKGLILIVLIAAAFMSCSKDNLEPEPEHLLAGTLWSAYNYKSVVDGRDVYRMLRFINKTGLEYYSASEKGKLIGTKDTLQYRYNHPRLEVDFNGHNQNGKTYIGEVGSNYIILNEYTYNKEN